MIKPTPKVAEKTESVPVNEPSPPAASKGDGDQLAAKSHGEDGMLKLILNIDILSP